MNTNTNPHDAASEFRGRVKGLLAHQRKSVGWLARQINKSRGAVSRAINRGEFPNVQQLIDRMMKNGRNP